MARSEEIQHRSDRKFCWEQVQRVRPGLRMTLQYAPAGRRLQLLGVYAWLSAVEDAVSRTSADHVGRLKLGWWHQELIGGDPQESSHPVIRTLRISGALKRIPEALFSEEIRLATRRVDRSSLTDMNALMEEAVRIGQNQLRFETALEAMEHLDIERLRGCLAMNGLVQVVRESARSNWLGCWWLPLDIRARHGIPRDVNPDEWELKSVVEGLQEVWREAQRWAPDWSRAVAPREGSGLGEDACGPAPSHWLIQSHLQAFVASRLGQRSPARLTAVLAAVHVSDAWRIWRFARRLERTT